MNIFWRKGYIYLFKILNFRIAVILNIFFPWYRVLQKIYLLRNALEINTTKYYNAFTMLKLILDPVRQNYYFCLEKEKKKENPETQMYLTKNKN